MHFDTNQDFDSPVTTKNSFTMCPNGLLDTFLNASEKLTYIALLRYSGKNRSKVWPSQKTLSLQASSSVSTVQRSLLSLQSKGFLKTVVEKTPTGRRNVYFLATMHKANWGELINRQKIKPAETTEENRGGSCQNDVTDHVTVTQEQYSIEQKNKIRMGIQKPPKSDQESDLTPEQKSTVLDIEKPTNPTPEVSIELARQETGRSLNAEPSPKASPSKPLSDGARVWNEYAQLFVLKYRAAPIRNAKTNTICKRLIEAVGLESALKLVAYFLSTNHSFYVQRCHDIALCLYDIHKLSVELASGERRFRQDANKAEKAQHLHQEVAKLEIEQDLRPGENIFDKIAREYEEGKAQRDEERKRLLE